MAAQIVPNGTLFGFYRALVVDDKDPKMTGRVKVHIPDIMPDKGWALQWCTDGLWAHPGNNMLGGRNTYDIDGVRCSLADARYQGQCMIPPKGSHVFIVFEKGDPNRPYYVAAADYGQTKVLAENRCGPEYQKKWTLIKTHEGRACVYSDDPYDARVEITGKKRNIHNSPDGDTESVYNIDGNQTVFLIDERPGHEKVFLKDYRGNYIKAIQDENGINDQLHVFFKDDIHIETLKNIYIQAHENIHVTADQDIYITAMQNMYTYVKLHFSEMANLIDRYSNTNDNRYAGVDINDLAMSNAARKAGASIKDMAGGNSSRSAGGFISDGAGGSMSIQSAGTMSVLGASTFVDGATTTINNGSAPIAPEKGIEAAVTTPMATLPTPDPSRHFTPVDDGWAPVAPEENPQNKCHVKFWKPQYNWHSISQCHNAKVMAGGCGAAPASGGGGGGSGGSGGSGSGSGSSSGSSSGCSGCSNSPACDAVASVAENAAASAASAMARSVSSVNNIISVNNEVQQILENTPHIALPAVQMNNIIQAASADTSAALVNTITQQMTNVTACTGFITDAVNAATDPILKNRALLMLSSTLSAKSSMFMNSMYAANPIANAITSTAIAMALDPVRTSLDMAIGAATTLTQAVVSDCLHTALTSNNSVVSGIASLVSGTIGTFLSATTGPAVAILRTNVLNYPAITAAVGTDIVSAAASRLTSDIAGEITRSASLAATQTWASTGIGNIGGSIEATMNSVGNMLGGYYGSYASGMTITDLAVNTAVNTFTNFCNAPDLMNTVNNSCNSMFRDFMGMSPAYCDSIVAGAMVGTIAADAISSTVFGALVNSCVGSASNVLTVLSNSIGGTIDGIISTLDRTCAPYNYIDGICDAYHTQVDPVFASELNSFAVNNLVSVNPVAIQEAVMGNVGTAVGLLVADTFGGVATDVINCITSNMVSVDGLMSGLNYTALDAALDTMYAVVGTPLTIASNIANGYAGYIVGNTCLNTYNNILTGIDPESYAFGYDTICSYNPASYVGTSLTTYLMSNVIGTLTELFTGCSGDFVEPIINEFKTPTVPVETVSTVASGFVDDFNRGVANTVNDITDGLAVICNNTCAEEVAPRDGATDCCTQTVDYMVNNSSRLIERLAEDVTFNVSNGVNELAEENAALVQQRLNAIDSDVVKAETQGDFADAFEKITRPLEDPLNIVGDMLYTDIKNDLEGEFEKGGFETTTVLNSSDDSVSGSTIGTTGSGSTSGGTNTGTGTTGDGSGTSATNSSGNGIISGTVGGEIVNVKNTLGNECLTDCVEGLTESVKDAILELCSDEFAELNTMYANNDPENWSSDEIMRCKELCDIIKEKITNFLLDGKSVMEAAIDEGLVDKIVEKCEPEVSDGMTTKEDTKEAIVSDLRKHAAQIANNFKQICTDNIILTENVTDNEFSQNVDLTDVYSIPGIESAKYKCECPKDGVDTENEYLDTVWCSPEVIGGCGCCYEYMLFLKHKFFQTILPIVYNDGIKTIGISLNPNMEKLTDTTILHDSEIVAAYNELMNHFFVDNNIDISDNAYLNRIDELMTECESLDCTAVVNLMDFTCNNYKWLEGLAEIDKYTHEITDERFLNFITMLMDYVYFKIRGQNKKRRTCRIVLNIGNRSYDNTEDVDREKFDMYPNCGYIRELVMHLCYNCGVSSNYMSIPANDKDNLYYYSPYSEFKSYDEDKTHELGEYEICTRDYVDEKTNGRADAIKYGTDGSITGGYFNYYTKCDQKSYVMSYIDNLMDWCNDKRGSKTVLQQYTYDGDKVDSNIMNEIFTPNARKVLRYMYKGHKLYFKHVDCEFDPETGDML